ncbi:hypothetical protein SNE40_018564 [Patella caerulea]|uniref:EGF-like domain-containing protein n=1 Tax=Patella caerulea TaxID=87958 RepID=A0AAN8J570_PATCE
MFALNCFLVLWSIITLASAQLVPSGGFQSIQADLEKGGRAVCQYCYGCMFAGLCEDTCRTTNNPLCQLCNYKQHCETTCATLCTRPDPCENNPCAEDRKCQELTNGGTAYRCICPPGNICQRRRRTETSNPGESILTRFITDLPTTTGSNVEETTTKVQDTTTGADTTRIISTRPTTRPTAKPTTRLITNTTTVKPTTRRQVITRRTTSVSAPTTTNPFRARTAPTRRVPQSSQITNRPTKVTDVTSRAYSTTGISG